MFSKSFFKSFLLLLLLNTLILIFLPLLPLRYLFPILTFLVIFNIFLLFYSEFLFIKTLKLQSPFLFQGDPWGIDKIWTEQQKNKFSKKNHYYILNRDQPFSLCFSNLKGNHVVFSKSLLELLTEEEKKALVCYYFTGFYSGWSPVLTLLSCFHYLIDKLFFLLETPFRLFRKNKSPLFFPLFLKILSLPIQKVYFLMDKETKAKEQGKAFPKLLWKTQSLYKMDKMKLPDWLTPVFFGNPLTWKVLKWYFSFQPKMPVRVKTLIGTYPP